MASVLVFRHLHTILIIYRQPYKSFKRIKAIITQTPKIMKKTILMICLSVIMVSMVMVSCKKDSTSSSTSQVSFALSADNSISPISATNNGGGIIAASTTTATAGSISWTSGIVNISKFKLEAKKNGKQIEIESKNLSNVDLFALTPSLISASIDTGIYKEIEIRAVFTKSTTADIPVKLRGTFTTAGGAIVPIEFDFNDDATFNAEAENITVNSTTDFTAKLHLHLNIVLSDVVSAELDKATRINGTIIISSDSNPLLYAKAIVNIAKAMESKGYDEHKRI
ncbi:MAG: hypothetical protein JWR76_2228 [Mucilaginibacter sp.]|nr:hypothetical protein [Mucilaginibacter sp.]